MRPRYGTAGIVLARTPLAEASSLLHMLTADFGLVRARAQGVRKAGAKLACAVQTLAECDATLVRGKDGWRLSGAVLATNWFSELTPALRERAARASTLVLRLIHGESQDAELFLIFKYFLAALPTLSDEQADAAECLVALRIVHALGFDAGEVPGEGNAYDNDTLQMVIDARRDYITRINRGIVASGL